MPTPAFDPEALTRMFESASATQSEQLRSAVREATLAALKGRELSLTNIREALKSVSQAASTGAAKNAAPVDVEVLLNGAVAGMDDALLKAVEANRAALQQFVAQGEDLQQTQLKNALTELEKFEDTLMSTVKNAGQGLNAPLAGPWAQVFEKWQVKGTTSGAQATATAEQLAAQMQTALRDSRAAGLRTAQALAQSYTALVSGVLIGMSEALTQGRDKPGA